MLSPLPWGLQQPQWISSVVLVFKKKRKKTLTMELYFKEDCNLWCRGPHLLRVCTRESIQAFVLTSIRAWDSDHPTKANMEDINSTQKALKTN